MTTFESHWHGLSERELPRVCPNCRKMWIDLRELRRDMVCVGSEGRTSVFSDHEDVVVKLYEHKGCGGIIADAGHFVGA
jgi:hypothetical protein